MAGFKAPSDKEQRQVIIITLYAWLGQSGLEFVSHDPYAKCER